MVQYKLNYFNIRGRGEIVRLIFVAAGQEFIDNRIEHSNWPQLKANAPMGQLPYLEILGSKSVKISQSMTICKFQPHQIDNFKTSGPHCFFCLKLAFWPRSSA